MVNTNALSGYAGTYLKNEKKIRFLGKIAKISRFLADFLLLLI